MLGKQMCKKGGFGIVEVLISAAVLGFMYLALLNLQLSNRQSLIRIRGRDAAVEVAQQVLDSLQAIGVAAIPCKADGDTVFDGQAYERSWDRGLGGASSITYSTQLTVKPQTLYESSSKSNYQTSSYVYAKNVMVRVSWLFKGSTQSITISGVIR